MNQIHAMGNFPIMLKSTGKLNHSCNVCTTHVNYYICSPPGGANGDACYQTEITQKTDLIRCRALEANPGVGGIGDSRLPEGFSALTNLTQLDLVTSFQPISWLQPIMGLPALESINIMVDAEVQGLGAGLFLMSTCLTLLDVAGADFEDVLVITSATYRRPKNRLFSWGAWQLPLRQILLLSDACNVANIQAKV